VEEEGKGTAAAIVGGLDVGRPLLGALVAEEEVALVEADHPGELLLAELWALEPRAQDGGYGELHLDELHQIGAR
jgi:hypothetical protein